jgi:hypothetical protein
MPCLVSTAAAEQRGSRRTWWCQARATPGAASCSQVDSARVNAAPGLDCRGGAAGLASNVRSTAESDARGSELFAGCAPPGSSRLRAGATQPTGRPVRLAQVARECRAWPRPPRRSSRARAEREVHGRERRRAHRAARRLRTSQAPGDSAVPRGVDSANWAPSSAGAGCACMPRLVSTAAAEQWGSRRTRVDDRQRRRAQRPGRRPRTSNSSALSTSGP